MTSDDNAQDRHETPASPLIVVVGAGPKAAALAAKAKVLKELRLEPEVKVVVIERSEVVGANWTGGFGYTDGENELCTLPEKDIGFPYSSKYGSDVDMAMFRYTWQAHQIYLTAHSSWLDRGRPQPRLKDWAGYVQWVLQFADPAEILTETIVTKVTPSGGKLVVTAQDKHKTMTYPADGVVFTSPGEPIPAPNSPADPKNRIFDGKNYWTSIDEFRSMRRGKVAIIGGGGTAASIALSLLQRAPVLDIDIINRHGAIFTRGESFREKQWFSNPRDWPGLDEDKRIEFIKRTDRGVFSVSAQRQLDQAEKLDVVSGEVMSLAHRGEKVIAQVRRGDPPKDVEYEYDRVIVALGFDPFSALELIPEPLRPKCRSAADRLDIQRKVDEYLRLPFDTVPELAAEPPNIHVPMLAGLAQGPGFPNLTCLGHLSDRILSRYVKAPKPAQHREAKRRPAREQG